MDKSWRWISYEIVAWSMKDVYATGGFTSKTWSSLIAIMFYKLLYCSLRILDALNTGGSPSAPASTRFVGSNWQYLGQCIQYRSCCILIDELAIKSSPRLSRLIFPVGYWSKDIVDSHNVFLQSSTDFLIKSTCSSDPWMICSEWFNPCWSETIQAFCEWLEFG